MMDAGWIPFEGTIPFFLKISSDKDGVGPGKGQPLQAPEQEEKEDDKLILCANCKKVITRPSERISIQGAHRHTFANPHGIVYDIGCFAEASGCRYTGAPTSEFTWFSGYQWRIAMCSGCLLHLGWLFLSSGGNSFNGLIIDRLLIPE